MRSEIKQGVSYYVFNERIDAPPELNYKADYPTPTIIAAQQFMWGLGQHGRVYALDETTAFAIVKRLLPLGCDADTCDSGIILGAYLFENEQLVKKLRYNHRTVATSYYLESKEF